MIIPRNPLNLNLATRKPPNPNHFIKFAPTRDHILCNQIWKEASSPCKDSGNAPNIPNSWNLMSLYCEAKTRCEPERLHLHRQRTNGQQELVKPVYSDHKLVTCRNTTHTDHWREMRAPSAASAWRKPELAPQYQRTWSDTSVTIAIQDSAEPHTEFRWQTPTPAERTTHTEGEETVNVGLPLSL